MTTDAERALIDAALEWDEMQFASVPLLMTAERKLVQAIRSVERERREAPAAAPISVPGRSWRNMQAEILRPMIERMLAILLRHGIITRADAEDHLAALLETINQGDAPHG
jgi:hypothetical protein